MKHQWNTGRGYDQHGQRIVAEAHEKEVRFSDLSRGIDGAIPLGHYLSGRDIDPYTLEKLVMANYDLNNYSGSGVTLTWDDTL